MATAAAAAKSLQSCPTLCNPIDGSPPGSSVHGIFQAKVLELVAIAFSDQWPHSWQMARLSLDSRCCFTTLCRQPVAKPRGPLAGSEVEGEFGFCLWRTGVQERPNLLFPV